MHQGAAGPAIAAAGNPGGGEEGAGEEGAAGAMGDFDTLDFLGGMLP